MWHATSVRDRKIIRASNRPRGKMHHFGEIFNETDRNYSMELGMLLQNIILSNKQENLVFFLLHTEP